MAKFGAVYWTFKSCLNSILWKRFTIEVCLLTHFDEIYQIQANSSKKCEICNISQNYKHCSIKDDFGNLLQKKKTSLDNAKWKLISSMNK